MKQSEKETQTIHNKPNIANGRRGTEDWISRTPVECIDNDATMRWSPFFLSSSIYLLARTRETFEYSRDPRLQYQISTNIKAGAKVVFLINFLNYHCFKAVEANEILTTVNKIFAYSRWTINFKIIFWGWEKCP